jgi:diguanylate cyclase (GGDEF)-like protein/PAS domain S-box-containing protein
VKSVAFLLFFFYEFNWLLPELFACVFRQKVQNASSGILLSPYPINCRNIAVEISRFEGLFAFSYARRDPNEKMKSIGRTDKELDPLWEKLADLKRLDSDWAAAGQPAFEKTSDQLRAEIELRLGFLPPFFNPALESPVLLDGLWRQQLSWYYSNPLPELFKEKLSARLSRYCESPYFMVTHACTLHKLGIPAREIRGIVEIPVLTIAGVEQVFEMLAKYPHPIERWPEEEPAFEERLIIACAMVFLGREESARCAAEIRALLGPANYSHLIALLAGIKAAHVWVDAHPEIVYEGHPVVRDNFLSVVQSEPQMAELFRNHKEALARWSSHADSQDAIPGSPDLYRELFENASDIIYTHNFDGGLISINRAVERITGYTRAEALQLNLVDVIAPEYAHMTKKMIDPQIGGEVPLNFELEIITKDKSRITLGISTRPIFRGGKPIAVQGIARDITKRKKTEADLHEANQKLEAWVTELEQRTREMTLLNDMGDILRACLTSDEAYNVIVRVAQQIFPVQVGALYIIAPSRNSVEAVAVWGDTALAERAFSPPECWALRRGRMHWVENSRSGLICKHIHHSPPDGYLCIPMMAQSEAIGVLHLIQPDNVKMTETKQRMAVTMSEHIAMALSNLRLHETLRSQSIRDPLTGLFNRRFMEESLELELRRASRNNRPLGMIMIDLDHFKFFNDNFGHEAGDLLLKELGALLRGNIRGEDIACRYGGEEFTLILPEGTGAVTRQRAEFYKEAIQRLDVHYRGRPLGRITASMGVALFPDHGRTAKALIEAADKALYRSKSAGRDRVTLAG